jgi:hypothetical protein
MTRPDDSTRSDKLVKSLEIGHVFPFAIPPVKENTRHYPAGALTFGLEYRHFSSNAVNEAYKDDPEKLAISAGARDHTGIDDHGMSLHVFDTDSMFEPLRFDMFEKDPHYHYTYSDRTLVILYDVDANGDMWNWVISRLTTRLGPMLKRADASQLAERISADSVDAALKLVSGDRDRILAELASGH